MKAVVWTRYGPPEVLQLRSFNVPVPRRGEVLINIRATAATAGDCELRGLKFSILLRVFFRLFMGFTAPRNKILGQQLAGIVVGLGPGASRFKKGDRVFGSTGLKFGAYAEFIALPEQGGGGALALMPEKLSFEEAATVPTGGFEAVHFLRMAGDIRGRKMLIIGAGGGIGTIGVQLAKLAGAEVTAVDRTEKLDLLRRIGADTVVDYTRSDFTRTGKTYDVILDVVGASPFSGSLTALNENGRYLLGNPNAAAIMRAFRSRRKGGRRIYLGSARHDPAALDYLGRLMEEGKVRPIIDRRFPLEQIAEAHRYVESGLAGGTVVILT